MFGILDGIFGILDESSLQNRKIFSEKLVFSPGSRKHVHKTVLLENTKKNHRFAVFFKKYSFSAGVKTGLVSGGGYSHCIN